MTLLSVRVQFVKNYSGRYDLVVDTDDWEDNGANFFIQAGQKWLDTTFTIARTQAIYYITVGSGGWYALIPSARVVHHIWMSNNEEVRWELDRITLSSLRNMFPEGFSNVDPDRPQFFAPLFLRDVPETLGEITLDQVGQIAHTVSGDIHGYNAVLWGPPCDEEVTIAAEGLFYQPPLLADDDVNYWSEVLPNVLCMAAARELEITYRNTAGVTDWEKSIKTSLLGFEMDLADNESAGISQMEG
jgi:hypothetical protein